MSSINGVGGNYPIKGVSSSGGVNRVAPQIQGVAEAGEDRVELSTAGVGEYLKLLSGGSDVRSDKVASVKAAIQNGSYESDQKLNVAIDRLLDDLSA